ncbi:hypothetical protein HNP33_003043 [Comamonas odontotermitis]|uniref:Helicase ATP-binding domain-containing protein n=1 Tax=Comamonas odontotermitis TaxID=379895 RepID=A0ABR6RIP4_9BURK|nr:PLxRFG domain-containing protein [Comamonas odontotermitis]MBB6578938.1 hypothetical protein [Comamonas odontotermitis]
MQQNGQNSELNINNLAASLSDAKALADFSNEVQQAAAPTIPEYTSPVGLSSASVKPSKSVDDFVGQVLPMAQRVSEKTGAPVDAIIGQWGLETGWGKSVIPGTNNLGNIKDFSGRGVSAKDNMTGSVDKYRAYENGDAFADDFAGLLGKGRYRNVIGSKDAGSYFTALKQGGYAEDPDYIRKGVAAAGMASASLAKLKPAPTAAQEVPAWAELASKPEFAEMSAEQQRSAKEAYFDTFIKPRAGGDADTLRAEFLGGAPAAAGASRATDTPATDPQAGQAAFGVNLRAGRGRNKIDRMGEFNNDQAGQAGSVLTRENIKANAPVLKNDASGIPLRPEMRQAVQGAWDAATPEQRKALEAQDTWQGQVARQRAEQMGAADSARGMDTLAPAPLDTRAEARRQRLMLAGEQAAFAETMGKDAARKSLPAGKELMANPTVGNSDFDFETAKLFNPNQSGNGVNNAVARGVAKAALGIGQTALGLSQFAAEVGGADELAKDFASANNKLIGQKTAAIGERGDMMTRNLEGAINSIGQQLPLLMGGAALKGGQALVLGGIAAQSFGQEYAEGREKSLSVADATKRAALFAAFEVIGERFGLGHQLDALRGAAKGMPSDQIAGLLFHALSKEVPGEVLTTTGQFATDKFTQMGLNKGATFNDYLGQVADTIVQTLMQGGIMAGGTSGVGKVASFLNEKGPSERIMEAEALVAKDRAMNAWAKVGKPEREQAENTAPVEATPTGDGRIEPVLEATAAGGVAAEELLTPAAPVEQSVPEAAQTGAQAADEVLGLAAARYQTLRSKRDGEVVQDSDGNYVEDGAQQLTAAEQAELRALEQYRGDADRLAAFYGLNQQAAPVDAAVQDAPAEVAEQAAPEAAYNASEAEDRAAYDWATRQEQEAPAATDANAELDIPDPLSGKSNVSQADAMRSLGFSEEEINGTAAGEPAQPVSPATVPEQKVTRPNSVEIDGDKATPRARWDAMDQDARASILMQSGSGITQAEAEKVAATPGKKLTQRRLDLVKDALQTADRTEAEVASTAKIQEGMKAFPAETGTMGVPRAEMPQVPAQSHGALVKHLNAKGIEHETQMVNAGALKPTQAEYSTEKVEKAKTAKGDRAVIVSSDGHIIDGHHQAVAAAEEGKPVKAIVLDAPVEQALQAVKDSPSANGGKAAAAPESEKTYGAANKLVTADRAAELRERLKKKLGQLNSGIDPEMLAIGTELAVFHIEAGARKFADFAEAIARDLETPISKIRPYLRSWYNGARDMMEDSNLPVDGMDSSETVRGELAKLQDTPTEAHDNAASPRTDLESDSTKPAAGSVLAGGDERRAGRDGQVDRGEGGRVRGEAQPGQQGDSGIPADRATADGERGDQRVHTGDGVSELAGIATGSDFRERGGDVGVGRVPPESIPTTTVRATATAGLEAAKARAGQRDSLKTPIARGIENVRATLPSLLPGQQEDVVKAETRFDNPDGYGMLFTNGTGTGKTFTGLGVIARKARQGKNNILVVVPDDKVLSDWIDSGKKLDLSITALADTKDAGHGVVVTTYANVGQNNQLARRSWDLIVADEAHKLMQSEDAKETDALKMVRALTLHPDGVWTRHYAKNADKLEEVRRLSDERKAAEEAGDKPATVTRLQEKIDDLNKELRALYEREKEFVLGNQGEKRPRALFLSATPFAYEKTVDWANGYLFEYPQAEGGAYNSGDGRQQFMMQHFGYRMRYNKLTAPEAGVDSGLMQRNFNSWLKREGVLSSRVLDVDADYDRRFVLIDSDLGNRIDAVFQWIDEQSRAEGKDQKAYHALEKLIRGSFDYLSRRYLLEAIKSEHSIPYVKKQLELGRKVVVFHDYKKGGGFNPFNVTANEHSDYEGMTADQRAALAGAVSEFRGEFKDLLSSGLENMLSPIEAYKKAFGDQVMAINGDEKAKAMLERYKKFNNDAELPAVLLVQSAKNAGWSGHDTTGKYQRALVNLGQPSAPTMAIQQEGRIYRTGQKSDAIIRYFNTGTSWEKHTFAGTIAGRASAAENLSLGEEARALKDAFIQAFEESDYYEPGHEGEGKGGKVRDRQINSALTEWDRAKAYYFGTQKKTAKTKAQEGKDYFATPEPLGLKMVQWADMRPGEDAIEPSAGHGAIARWFPDAVKRTVVEPSSTLRARLALNINPAEDRVVDGTFEDLAKSNKYDAIVMNPPFGVGGKTAMDHVDKAWGHLRDGGRLVALIPTGPAADKRLDAWLYGVNEKGQSNNPDAMLMADVTLPQVAFERAGTSVATRVLVLEKQSDADKRAGYGAALRIDLSGTENISDFFDRLEDIGLPTRAKEVAPIAQQAKALAETKKGTAAAVAKTWRGAEPIEAYVTKRGKTLYGVWRSGLTKEQAQEADPYTWNKGGKWFIRQEHLSDEVPAPKLNRKDQEAADALGKQLGLNVQATEQDDADLAAIAGALGSKLVRVDVPDADFNGAYYKGTTFITRNTDRPALAVLGHEFAHELRDKAPGLYKKLVDAISPYIEEKAYKEEFVGSKVAPDEMSKDATKEEFIGEVFSDGFMNKDFWRAVGKSNKQLLVQVQNALARLVRRVLVAVGYTPRTEKYLSDFKKVMQIAGEVMAEYNLSQVRLQKHAGIELDFDTRRVKAREFLDGPAVATLSGNEFARDGVPLTDKVPQWYAATGNALVHNPAIGQISLDKQAVSTTIAHGIGRNKSIAFASVPDVLRHGMVIHAEAMRGAHDDAMVYHVAAPVKLGDADMVQTVMVRKDENGARLYTHEIVPKKEIPRAGFKTGALKSNEDTPTGPGGGIMGSVLRNVFADNGVKFAGEGEAKLNRQDQPAKDAAESAADKAIEAIAQPTRFKTFNWYDKTLSTQYAKALKDKHFGKVFGLLNAQQSAVSMAAIRPSELAPMVLPKVDGVVHAFKQLVVGQGDLSPLGRASKALFAGTLAGEHVLDGKVFSEQELREKFGADDAAVAAYQQARAAIDASLMEVASAEVYALAATYLPADARREIMNNPMGAQSYVLGEFDKQIATTTKAMEAVAQRDPDIAASIGAQLTRMQESRTKAAQIFSHAQNLANAGYVPLMRFGDYTVTVTALDDDGSVLYDENGDRQTVLFQKFETQAEANAALRAARNKYKNGYLVEHGHDSKKSHELLRGVTPETIALFADVVGFDTVTQKYYEAALSERSALKRRLERKGTPGFSTDLPRMLSSFITSNARLASQRYYNRDINNAIRYIPQAKGDVKDEAVALRQFMGENKDGGAMASSLAFAWFLGGNVASALVNMTQPVMMTAPYLTQFGNPLPHLAKALPYALGKKQMADEGLKAALKRAGQEGIVDAQEIFHLYSAGTRGLSAKLVSAAAKVPGLADKVQSSGEGARARAQAFFTLWGSMFAAAEGFNRRLSFIAAWNMAVEQGQKDPYAFAVRAVNQTQGIYNKVSRPNWARSTTGRLLFTFKQYSLTYIELLNRMFHAGPAGKRAALTMLAVLVLASGEEGLPFAHDLDDLIDTVGQMFGLNTNMKRAKRDWAYATLGKTFGDLALYGVSAHLPLDFSGRLGLGNLIPGTGVLKPSNETIKSREATEVLGPIFSLVTQAADAVGALDEGNVGKAAANLAPTAVRNAIAGAEIMRKGYNTDARGRKVMDLPASAGAIKALGFNPTANAEKTRSTMPLMQDAALLRKRQNQITGSMTQAIIDQDDKALAAAVAQRDAWNDRYPDTPIVIKPTTIRSRIKNATLDKDMRVLKSVPKTMRAQAVNSMAGAEE